MNEYECGAHRRGHRFRVNRREIRNMNIYKDNIGLLYQHLAGLAISCLTFDRLTCNLDA